MTHAVADAAAVNEVIGRIFSIKYDVPKACELKEYITDNDATLVGLNWPKSPILKHSGFGVILEPKEDERNSLTRPSKKRAISSVADVLMGKALQEVSFLTCDVNMDDDPNLQQQLNHGLTVLMHDDLGLGYCDDKQEKQLKTNRVHMNGSLCFIQRHWKTLFRLEFPNLPHGTDSSLLRAVASTNRELKPTKR